MKRHILPIPASKLENKLWDVIMKTIAMHSPEQFMPLINEIYGDSFSAETAIEFLSTEYPVLKKKNSQSYSTIFSDIVMRIANRSIYHLEWQTNKDVRISLRMFEYDSNIARIHSLERENAENMQLHFPKSAIIFLGCNDTMPKQYTWRIILSDGTEAVCKIPVIKVQEYSLAEIQEKHLSIFLPFTLLRLRPRLRSKENPLTKRELTNFVENLIVILRNEKTNGFISELQYANYVQYIKLALEQILFHKPELLQEVFGMFSMVLPSYEEQEQIIAQVKAQTEAKCEAKCEEILASKAAAISKWEAWAASKGYKEEEFPQ